MLLLILLFQLPELLFGTFVSSEDNSIFLLIGKERITVAWDKRRMSYSYSETIKDGKPTITLKTDIRPREIVVERVDSNQITLRSHTVFNGTWLRQ